MAIVRTKLSASSGGAPITVTTGTAPTTLHTTTGLTSITSDEVHVWFVNNGASTVTVSLYWGTTAVNPVVSEVPSHIGPYLVAAGWYLATLVAYANAGATGVDAYGIVNRLTTGA